MPVKIYLGSTHTPLKYTPSNHITKKKKQNNLWQKEEIIFLNWIQLKMWEMGSVQDAAVV